MIINEIILENIRSYQKEVIRFNKQSILLKGDVGSGKSTILYALEFALFGILRGELSGSSLLRHGCKEGKVILSFNIENNSVVIERNLKKTSTRIEQSSGSITINGLKIDATPVELKAKIFNLLGYPEKTLSQSKNLMYKYTVYTPQEEMKQIIYEHGEVRLNLLRTIFDLDKYKRIRENTSTFLKNLREQKKHYEGSLVDFEKNSSELAELTIQLRSKSEELAVLNPKVFLIKEELNKKNDELKKLEESKQTLNILNQELTRLKVLIQTKQEQNNNYDYEIKKLNEFLEKTIKPVIEPTNLVEKHEELLKLQRKKEIINKSIVEAITKQEHSKKIIEKLNELSTCPLCLQEVPHTHKQNILTKESTDTARYEEIINNNKEIRENLEKKEELLKKEIELINIQKQEFVKYLEQQKNFEEKKKLLEEYKKQCDIISGEKINLLKNEKELKQKVEQIPIGDFEKLKKDFDLMNEQQQKLLIEQARLKEQITNYQLQELKLKKEIEEKTKIKEKLQKNINYENWFNTFFIPLTETIEKQVLGRIYHNFNHLFKEWFNTLIDDEYLSARLDENFTPIIQQNGYETEVTNLSGGEKTACALAYRLALNNAINDSISMINTKKLLILDEPTDGFSDQQLDKMRDVLAQIKAEQIILVSHENKIESFVQNVINIEKVGNESRILV